MTKSDYLEAIRCPYCGGELDIHDERFSDEGIRVMCLDGCRRFYFHFEDVDDILFYFYPSGLKMPKRSNSGPTRTSRGDRRHTDYKKAIRKRRITRNYWSSRYADYYANLHQFSKNKIHCSCGLCTFRGPTHSDMMRNATAESQLREYYNEI